MDGFTDARFWWLDALLRKKEKERITLNLTSCAIETLSNSFISYIERSLIVIMSDSE